MRKFNYCENCVQFGTDAYRFYTYPCNWCKHRAKDSFEPSCPEHHVPMGAEAALDMWLEIGAKYNNSIVQWREWSEKHEPRKPIFGQPPYEKNWTCPNCKCYGDIQPSTYIKYCPECGQRIDWEVRE